MFPNFTSLSQRESKRKALLRSYDRDLQNDAAKREAYSQAMWSDDVEKNKINLSKTTGIQTDATTDASTGPSTSTTSTGPSSSNGVFQQLRAPAQQRII